MRNKDFYFASKRLSSYKNTNVHFNLNKNIESFKPLS